MIQIFIFFVHTGESLSIVTEHDKKNNIVLKY